MRTRCLRRCRDFARKLVAEMKARIEPQESGVPLPDGPYAYWSKYIAGAEHRAIVRAPRNGGPEEVLLDGNVLAQGQGFFLVRRLSAQSRPPAVRLPDR